MDDLQDLFKRHPLLRDHLIEAIKDRAEFDRLVEEGESRLSPPEREEVTALKARILARLFPQNCATASHRTALVGFLRGSGTRLLQAFTDALAGFAEPIEKAENWLLKALLEEWLSPATLGGSGGGTREVPLVLHRQAGDVRTRAQILLGASERPGQKPLDIWFPDDQGGGATQCGPASGLLILEDADRPMAAGVVGNLQHRDTDGFLHFGGRVEIPPVLWRGAQKTILRPDWIETVHLFELDEAFRPEIAACAPLRPSKAEVDSTVRSVMSGEPPRRTHPVSAELRSYLDGHLGPPRRHEIDVHLASCSGCLTDALSHVRVLHSIKDSESADGLLWIGDDPPYLLITRAPKAWRVLDLDRAQAEDLRWRGRLEIRVVGLAACLADALPPASETPSVVSLAARTPVLDRADPDCPPLRSVEPSSIPLFEWQGATHRWQFLLEIDGVHLQCH